MTEEIITKRLHVSGLTPAITPKDLSQKLGSFGTVTALDGFGTVDALGQPKKFGYVTIETTKPKLARCMNLLSGVTWKGTKLRIGEAKPDFRERIAAEREAGEEPPRKKRRLPRGVQGTHAADMSLVTPENVAERGGWKVTPLGRLIRPIRMRPEHPLPEPIVAASSTTKTKAGKDDKPKKKKRAKEPTTRARRQTIDPTKFGSQHLKGVFLENAVVASVSTRVAKPLLVEPEIISEDDSSTTEDEDSSADEVEVVAEEKTALPPPSTVPVRIPPTPSPPPAAAKPLLPTANPSTDLAQEKSAALDLLQSLFGGKDDAEWGDRESLDSDIDMDDLPHRTSAVADEDDDIEVVPMDVDNLPVLAPSRETQEAEEESVTESEPSPPPREKTPPPKPTKSTKLKDLFAPRDDEAGFSLLGHLDLGSDLDEEFEEPFVPQRPLQATITPVYSAAPPVSAAGPTRFTIDQSKPFFYPVPEEARTGFRGRVKDPLDLMVDNGWDWRKFCRTETSDEIRQRWEAQKGELTRDWKRRHREAIKSRRRRGGAGDGDL